MVIEAELRPSIEQSKGSAQEAGSASLSCFTEGAAYTMTRISNEISGCSDIALNTCPRP
jgi:hypothetical protein